MAKIGFMINTEYHLILSCSIMQRYLAKGDQIFFYRVSPIQGSRLNNINVNDLPITYKEILYDYNHPTKKLKGQLDDIINDKLNRFFFFLENKFWFNYFFRKLKKIDTIICLAPDGMNAYENYCYSYKKRIKSCIIGFAHCTSTGIYNLPYIETNFAASKYIDEVWVEYPSFFTNSNNKIVVEFNVDYNDVFLSLLNKVFAFDPVLNRIEQGSILYIDSSYSENIYYERIIDILKKIQGTTQNGRIYIKLHQLSDKEKALGYYKHLNNVEFLNSSYPAELFIANSKHCTILSLISTSMLFHNPTAKYFWLYPLFKDVYNYSKLVNPTGFIKVVKKIDDLE